MDRIKVIRVNTKDKKTKNTNTHKHKSNNNKATEERKKIKATIDILVLWHSIRLLPLLLLDTPV